MKDVIIGVYYGYWFLTILHTLILLAYIWLAFVGFPHIKDALWSLYYSLMCALTTYCIYYLKKKLDEKILNKEIV